MFIYRKNGVQAYLILYVDDIIITASTTTLKETIIKLLKSEFPMSNSGIIHSFLGISTTFNDKGLFLNQSKYAEDIIARAGMSECKPCATPVDLKSKISEDEGKPLQNPTEYRSLAGALQYLKFTRQDISYAVQQLCLFMHDPREGHLLALKRVIRYIQGTKKLGLQLLRQQKLTLTALPDADWGGCPTKRCSTSGYCLYLGNNLVSWSENASPLFQEQARRLSTKSWRMR